ncbi:unnamed protein product [Meloidogyne enterolobii]|uniref:Uncharacterized protein n=1 Tax=Meloidogyne enterolobii TaxID=390850 RepID=A0ACB0Z3C7_MELEN
MQVMTQNLYLLIILNFILIIMQNGINFYWKRNLQFERSHLEGAIPFNLNIATYPSWNERQSLYSPQLFQQYIQRLGIDQNDQLVIYGRGPNGGMLESARVWFLFRIYGHENVGIVDGGLEALQNSDFELTNGTAENISLGNWTAKFRDDLLSTFEELTTVDNYGYCILSRLFWYNFLDSRPRNEFFGLSGIYVKFKNKGGKKILFEKY